MIYQNYILLMCINMLPEKLIQAIKKKEKWYEWNTFATNFTEGYIGVTITAQ